MIYFHTNNTPNTKQDGKLKESINIGPQDIQLEDKTLTIVYGTDFVNVNFINFCTYSKEIAQVSLFGLLQFYVINNSSID